MLGFIGVPQSPHTLNIGTQAIKCRTKVCTACVYVLRKNWVTTYRTPSHTAPCWYCIIIVRGEWHTGVRYGKEFVELSVSCENHSVNQINICG